MKKMICAIMLLCLIDFAMGVHINEIMYNPSGDDNNREFVEIKGSDNLTGYKIGDKAINDSLQMLQYFPSNFSLIVEEGYNYSGLNCSVYSVGATIGNNLDNGGDTIYLFLNGGLVDVTGYTADLAYGNDHSLELVNGIWLQSVLLGGSPCLENGNFTFINVTNTSINNTINDTINDTINVTINDTINVTINTTINDTINNTFNNSINNTINDSINDSVINTTFNESCNLSLMLYLEKTLYENQEKVEFYNVLPDAPEYFLIEYWIEDLYGNLIRRHNTTNLNAKSFTPNIEEKEKAFIIRNRLLEPQCNASSEEYIIVRNNASSETPEQDNISTIEIKELIIGNDNSAAFGEIIKVRVNIYKGKTTKNAVQAYLQGDKGKISEITSLNFYTQYSINDLSIPLALLPNCDKKLAEGKYELVVEGLDAIDKEELDILGYDKDSCGEIKSDCPICPKCDKCESKSFNQTISSILEKLKNMTEYEIIDAKQISSDKVETHLRIRNKQNFTINYEVYSYIYKGSKCYSGNRTDNLQNLTLPPGKEATLTLMNSFIGLPGEYKLRISIKKDYRKLPDELTKDLKIQNMSNALNSSFPQLNLKADLKSKDSGLITGEAIYLSKNMRATKYIKYFIIVLFALTGIIYFVRKHGQKRAQEEDNGGLGKSPRNIRAGWQSQATC